MQKRDGRGDGRRGMLQSRRTAFVLSAVLRDDRDPVGTDPVDLCDESFMRCI